ncbi:hypothetical protein G9A89_017985 [Geosiphon pyriformis]|nr:hypothetical protein G9A89_017985 [Geosiphon pyriformis]
MPLFSGAALEKKLIMAMYTDTKVNGYSIKLILDSGHQIDHTASTRIITVDEATKTSIGEINDFSIEVNGIVVLIKVLVIKATQYQALINNNWLFKTNAMLDWMTQELVFSQNNTDHDLKEPPIWEWDKKEKEKRKMKKEEPLPTLICVDCDKKLSSMGIRNNNLILLPHVYYRTLWKTKPSGEMRQYIMFSLMALTKIQEALSEEIKKVKNNLPELLELDWNKKLVINLLEPEEFHEHYQTLTLTREE